MQKNRKWPFSWPLSDLSEIMVYVAYKGYKSTHFSLLPFFGLVNLGQVTGCLRWQGIVYVDRVCQYGLPTPIFACPKLPEKLKPKSAITSITYPNMFWHLRVFLLLWPRGKYNFITISLGEFHAMAIEVKLSTPCDFIQHIIFPRQFCCANQTSTSL